MEQKETNKSAADKAMDFIIIIISSTAAPLISHVLETLSPNNTWDTDRLVVLYFASLSGYVVANKIRRFAKNSSKFHFLNYSTIVHDLIWFLPVVVVAFCYEYPLALCILIGYFVISFAVLRKDWDVIQINYPKLLLIAIITVIMILLGCFVHFDSLGERIFPGLLILLGMLVVTSYLFDKIENTFNKKRETASKVKESK